MKLKRFYPYLLLAPTLIILLGVTLYPFIYSVRLSFFSVPFGRIRYFAGLENYAELLHDPFFWNGIKNTGIIGGSALTLEFFIGFTLALLLSRKIKLRGLFRAIFIIPMMLIPVVAALIWRLMFFPGGSVVSDAMRHLRLVTGDPNWIGQPTLARLMLIVMDVWAWTPFIFMILLAGLQGLPPEPLEAAEVDGANALQRFVHVTLPLLKPIIVIALLLRGMDAIKFFDAVYAVTGGGPGSSTETISFYLYRIGFKSFKMGYTSAMSVIVFVIVFALANYLLRKGFIIEE
jgi:multiple sugar transport system permease protein